MKILTFRSLYETADEWAVHPAPRFQEIKKHCNQQINKAYNNGSNKHFNQATKQRFNQH